MVGNHEFYMRRCLELAAMGMGNTAPNPMVGSVIVYDGKIIGEGYHRKCGQAHAEVNAIEAVKNPDLLAKAILYVNLEPCSHYGKTPPCAELIIRMGIRKVVVGTSDPNPQVNGKGIQMLKDAGCEVLVGILTEACQELNKRFFVYNIFHRPYIILKWAETADHFIDRERTADQVPEWITNNLARSLVHKWRSEEQAIMVGTNTALMDNPRLNVRYWEGKNPLRVVLDNKLRLPEHLHVFDGSAPTVVFTGESCERNIRDTQFVKIDFKEDVILTIIQWLYCNKIISVIVEGGTLLANSLLVKNYWDEARIFNSKAMFHTGIKAPVLNLQPDLEEDIDGVSLKVFKNKYL